MSDKPALYLLDGYGLIYRAYFAFARTPVKNTQGQVVSALYGFFRMVLSIIKEHGPERLVLVLDPPGPTFRHRMYPQYKATRQATPDDLRAQFPLIEEVVADLGLPVLRVNDYEADDVIATLARRCREEGRNCYIVSADKDLMQLIDDRVFMLRPAKTGGFEVLDAEGVLADKGVRPGQILDYLTLLGDSSDNVPGVKGVGEKTASKLLADFGSLDAAMARLDEVTPPGLRAKLDAGRIDAELSRRLIRLEDRVPGIDEIPMDSFGLAGLQGAQAAAKLRNQGIRVLALDIEKAFGLSAPESPAPAPAAQLPMAPGGLWDEAEGRSASGESSGPAHAPGEEPGAGKSALAGSGPLVTFDAETQHYGLVDTLEGLEALVARLEKAPVLCVDTETDGLDPHEADLAGVALCAGPGEAWYVALKGPGGTVIPLEQARPLICRLVQNPAIALVGQNFKFDWQILAHHGMEPHGVDFDTMIAAWMNDSTRNVYNMDALAEEFLSYRTIHFKDLFAPEVLAAGKKAPELLHFSRVPLEAAARYSAEDADVTFRLREKLLPLLEAKGLLELFRSVEMPLIPVLARIEYRGMNLDAMELGAYSQELEHRIGKSEQEIFQLVGHEFNLNSTKQLAQVLFEERKLVPSKKTKTGYSTDTSVLEELADQDPVPRKILEYRGLAKLKSTYVDALPALIRPRTGRIHTTMVQTGTATGRISSKDPNLQNIPIRDEDGRRIRKAFTASPGTVLVSADYSQIELVVMAHLAQDPGLASAFAQGIDVHKHTASLIFGIDAAQISPEQRRIAKTINFGVLYGMSAFRLSNELKIPRGQAKDFIDAYFASYPGIKGFIEATVARCQAEGGVRTMLGRWRPIPAIHSSNRTERDAAERVAVNTPIQGSAADIVKIAMVRLDEALSRRGLESRLVLQVHDELILECPRHEAAMVKELCREVMVSVLSLSVPLSVSVEEGERWGDMH